MPDVTKGELAIWEKKCRDEFEATLAETLKMIRDTGKRTGYFAVHWTERSFDA